MEHIKLIVSDLDGTLLTEDKVVSEKTKEAISACRKKGLHFVIASGRPVEPILELIKGWGIEDLVDYVIGMNGGAIYHPVTKEKEEFYLLDRNIMKEIMDHFKELDVRFMIYDGAIRYVNEGNEATRAEAVFYNEKEVETDLYALCEKDYSKIIVNCDAAYMPVVEQHAKQYHNDACACFKTAPVLFEYMDPRVNKSAGVQKICNHFGFTMNEVLAFGDTSNDNEMLRDVGVGVCMENGTDDTKAMADYITISNEEDGIAAFLHEHIL